MNVHLRRLFTGTALVGAVCVVAAAGLWHVGAGRWSFGDALYMAVISAATVGFSELPGFDVVPGARTITIATIFAGIGAFAFAQSSLTAFLVEGLLGEAFRRRRMQGVVDRLSGHVVVCGCGSTGRHVIEELAKTGTPFVVVERSREHLAKLQEELPGTKLLYVVGDATEDHTLMAAGIERASGVVAALTHDRDNLYVALSARTLNAKARIVAKVVEPEAAPKMLRAGANATVSPNTIGGRRMASEMLRPTVVEFLDEMMRGNDRHFRFEEVEIGAGSKFANRLLKDGPFRSETNALVVACRNRQERTIHYNPRPDLVLTPGLVLVVLGAAEDVQRLREMLGTE